MYVFSVVLAWIVLVRFIGFPWAWWCNDFLGVLYEWWQRLSFGIILFLSARVIGQRNDESTLFISGLCNILSLNVTSIPGSGKAFLLILPTPYRARAQPYPSRRSMAKVTTDCSPFVTAFRRMSRTNGG